MVVLLTRWAWSQASSAQVQMAKREHEEPLSPYCSLEAVAAGAPLLVGGSAGWILASCSTCGAVEGCLGSACRRPCPVCFFLVRNSACAGQSNMLRAAEVLLSDRS